MTVPQPPATGTVLFDDSGSPWIIAYSDSENATHAYGVTSEGNPQMVVKTWAELVTSSDLRRVVIVEKKDVYWIRFTNTGIPPFWEPPFTPPAGYHKIEGYTDQDPLSGYIPKADP